MKYRSGYKHVTAEDEGLMTPIIPDIPIVTEFIMLDEDGYLTIRRPYAWDGASGPSIDTKNSMTPSLVHDAFFQLFREDLLDIKHLSAVNRLLYDMLRERGMWRVRAWAWWKGVEMFGKTHADPRYKRPVLEVK